MSSPSPPPPPARIPCALYPTDPTLRGLPEEILLAIGRSLDTSVLELFFNDVVGFFHEVESPEWRGIRSLARTEQRLSRITRDALLTPRQSCHIIQLNLFRSNIPCHTGADILGDFPNMIPDRVFRGFDVIRVTIPLLFRFATARESHVLFACNLQFRRSSVVNQWVWDMAANPVGPDCLVRNIDDHLGVVNYNKYQDSLMALYRNLHKDVQETAVRFLNANYLTDLSTVRLGRMLYEIERQVILHSAITEVVHNGLRTRNGWRLQMPWVSSRQMYNSIFDSR